ncbi:MAG: alpha/beta fold hydrolase, partial [Rhodovibrionaceae bacterium]|nr:alpha/beta fold hydrolase [Rhodovibrionaceae bacterium]
MDESLKKSDKLDGVIRFPRFQPRSPWINGDLQTLRNTLLRPAIDLSPWPGHRVWVEMSDGSGDRLAAMLHRPKPEPTAGKPLIVLIHGLTGCEDSFYIRRSAREALRRGHPVLRVNLRGAGPSRRKSCYQYHAGRTEDLHDLLKGVSLREPDSVAAGAVLVGYSLGGNLVIKYLAEDWERPVDIRAAVSISAPIDLKATQRRIMQPRN